MSSGKVKCTCGWSWNKSDSSKKDMYICHECGRDNSNNMKNGGWLDSYADGGTMQEHQENYNNSEVSLPKGFVGMGNNTKGRNYSPAWGGQFQGGGKLKFLQPTSDKLPEGYRIPYSDPSSERAMSIGGENGEPAYLIPSFKYGRQLDDPIGEFKKTGEHLGGPFKTWQEAEEWEKTVRHPAVEKKETIMFPQEKFQMGGSVYPVNYVPQAQMGASIPGAVGFSYARTQSPAPSNGKYAKKTMPSAQNGVDMYGAPITANLKYDQSVKRTNYNPRTNTMIFGYDMPYIQSQEEKDKTLAHENRHAWQFNNDRTNFDIVHNPEYAFQERLKKKPESPSTDEVFNTYHNRKQKEVELDVKAFKMNNPDLAFMPDEIVYKKFVDSMQYDNPSSLEGEAQYYENTGRQFQNGGEMRYYQNGLDWKPKGMKDGGWLNKYDVAQNGYNFDKINIREVPRGVVNDNIPNASKMAIKQDEKFLKALQFKKEKDAKALKEWNALTKDEQERIIYNEQSKKTGTISKYTPDSKLSKFAQSMVNPFTALKDLYQKGEVRDNLLASVNADPKNNMNPLDLAYQATIGRAAAPYVASGATSVASAVSPYLAADAVVGGTTLTGVNLNNLITAGFATHGAMNIAPDTEEWLDNPSWEKAGEVGIDALEMLPVVGPASKTIGEGFNAVKNINTSISPELMEGLNTAGPSFRSSVNNVGNNVSNYIKNVKGLATGEAKKAQSKIDELLYEDQAIYSSKEYLENESRLSQLQQIERDMFNKLDQQKMPQYLPEQSKLSKQINFKENRINTANSLKLTDEGLVQSGKDTSLGLRTGSTDIINLETGVSTPISTSVPNEDVLFKLEGDQVTKTLNTGTEIKVTPEYTSTVKDNIDFIEKQIPGAKVFGSAKNVAEAEVPHIIGDYDVLMSQTQYDKFAKTNPEVGTNGFAKVHNIPGAAEGIEPIDINVIQEINGKAIGQRAQELFRQVAPDDFYKAAQEAIKNKSDIKIPYSSQELIEMTNPSSKSVVDAYESTKAKHLNKIDALINYGKPSVVTEGQQQYVKSLVGSKGSIGPQFPAEQLSDVATNETILDRINFIGNKKLVAADPERMQLALNDYYINNSVLVRQVDKGPIDKIEAAIKEYHPQAGGGAANGIGQNHVTLGFPNHGFGNITAVKQIGMDLDTTSPLAYLDDFEHQTSGSKLFTEDEQKILQDIVNDIKGTQTGDYNSFDDIAKMRAMNSKNSSELIERLPYSEEGKKALYDFAKQTNRQLVKKDYNYGTSNYTSTLRDFDEAIDAMKYSGLDQVEMNRVLKSFSERTQGAQSNPSRIIDEILPKQYKGIKGYLEGGIDRATERLARLQEERSRLGKDIKDIAKKVHNKKYKEEVDRIKSYQEGIDKQIYEMNNMRRELRQRQVDLREFKDDFTKHIMLATGVGTLAGIAKLYQYQESDEYKASRTKEWDEFVKENAEKEKKLQKMSPEERKKAEYEDKPFLDKTYDWFMGDKNKNDVAPTPTPFNEPVYGSPRKNGGIVNSDRGQWDYPGEITRIKGGNITMKRDPKTGKALTQPILGISNRGERKMMYPGQDYQFQNADYVTEYPISQNGLRQEQKGLQNLDQLTNFTNYNKPQPGGWLNKYN